MNIDLFRFLMDTLNHFYDTFQMLLYTGSFIFLCTVQENEKQLPAQIVFHRRKSHRLFSAIHIKTNIIVHINSGKYIQTPF